MEDWHWATSVNQARAVSLGINWWRSISPKCEGTVLWQLNDCWPVVSWAAVDGDGRRKPVWYALRRSYADRLLTVQPEGDDLVAVMVNDAASTWSAEVSVARMDFRGDVMAAASFHAEAAPGTAQVVPLGPSLGVPGDAAEEVLVVTAGDHRALWYWAEDKDLRLPAPQLAAEVTKVGNGFEVTVTAPSLQKDVSLLVDKVDAAATVDDMLVDLLPGQTVTFHVRTSADVEPGSFLRREVLRSVNQLTHAGFKWGVDTASYQNEGSVAEGGRSPSTWDISFHTPGACHSRKTGESRLE
jgi:beta-mannosidase